MRLKPMADYVIGPDPDAPSAQNAQRTATDDLMRFSDHHPVLGAVAISVWMILQPLLLLAIAMSILPLTLAALWLVGTWVF